MKIRNQEGDISLIERECGKTANGIFPEIQESFTDLAAGGVRKPCSEETKRKISQSLTGRHFSKKSKKKMSLAKKGSKNYNYGRPPSEEHRKNISSALTGKCHTKESRKKMSESHKGPKNYNYGRHLSEETKKKISLAKKGTPCSEETRKKISASVRLTLERKKRERLCRKRYYQKNRGKILAYTKKHHKDNREYYSNYYHKRRLDRIDAIFEKFGYSVEVLDRMGVALD